MGFNECVAEIIRGKKDIGFLDLYDPKSVIPRYRKENVISYALKKSDEFWRRLLDRKKKQFEKKVEIRAKIYAGAFLVIALIEVGACEEKASSHIRSDLKISEFDLSNALRNINDILYG